MTCPIKHHSLTYLLNLTARLHNLLLAGLSKPIARLWLWQIPITLWRPLLPHGYNYKASCARSGSANVCNFWHPGTLTLRTERQSARMSKITNDQFSPVWTLYSCTHTATVGVKGLRWSMTYSSWLRLRRRWHDAFLRHWWHLSHLSSHWVVRLWIVCSSTQQSYSIQRENLSK